MKEQPRFCSQRYASKFLVLSLGVSLCLCLGLGVTPGCRFSAPDIAQVPANPTFSADILPIFNDHCNLCHGAIANRGAPKRFRLDVYNDVNEIMGAASMGDEAVRTIHDKRMPPSAAWGDGLGPNAAQAVQRWYDQGQLP